MEHSKKVLLVDDHQIVLRGLTELLANSDQAYELATANSGEEAIEKLSTQYRPDVIISDLDMGKVSGKDLCQWIKEHHSETPVIILSMHSEKELIKDLLKAGASGYLTKSCSKTELEGAIAAVIKGKKFFSTDVLEQLSQEATTQDIGNVFLKHLSHRELEILRCIGNGLSSKETGHKLSISHRTVESHHQNLVKKLGTNNRAELIKIALKSGLVD